MIKLRILFILMVYVQKASFCTSGGAQPTTSQTTYGLRQTLGGDIRTELVNTGADGLPIRLDEDLFCTDFDISCSWKNSLDDQLDWTRGRGRADPQQWEYVTGTDDMPQDPYLVLASNPRDGTQNGVLISDPITCQSGDGTLSFKHWTSRANSESQRPTLRVCRRYVGSSTNADCQQVFGGPGPSFLSIPASDRSFQLLFEASNFVQDPQGGFVMLDDIIYDANVGEECDEETTYVTDPPTRRTRPTQPNRLSDEESCALATCAFDPFDGFCAYTPGEPTSNGGWEVTRAGRSRNFNPLTGVKGSPPGENDFAVASFLTRNNPMRHVLESNELDFSRDHYLNFHRYIATEGLQLQMCKDAFGFDCFWTSDPLIRGGKNAAAKNLKWIEEVVRLPAGKYKLFPTASYDAQQIHNVGQVGLSSLKITRDSGGNNRLC